MTSMQPMPLATRPGAGAGNAPSIESSFERGQARASAQALVKAQAAAPGTVPPFWYLDDDGWEEARRRALEMDLELSQQVWKTTLADKEAMLSRQRGFAKGDWWSWPARAQYEDIAKHEPLYEEKWKSEGRKMLTAIQDGVTQAQQAVQQGMMPPEQFAVVQQQAEMQGQQAQMQLQQMAMDPSMQAQVPGLWLAPLYKTCGRETANRMERYAELAKVYR